MSRVWKYFSVLENDITRAKCQLCGCLVSRGGNTKKSFSTTNLNNHLLRKHFEVLKKSCTEKPTAESFQENEKSIGSSPSHLQKLQVTIQKAFEKQLPYDFEHPQAKAITKCIGEMICADLQPFSVVEDDGFRRLMKHLAPRYEIPSGKHFSRVVIP